jgi:hypothetical protein
MLYDFKKLRTFLERVAPIVPNRREPITLTKGEDFTQKHNNGEVEYTDEGIFVIINGQKHQRYIYKKRCSVNYTGTPKFPKFHFIQCSTLKETPFMKDYFAANTEAVTIIDKYNGTEYPNRVLDVCRNCMNEAVVDVPVDTEAFFEKINEEALENKTVPTDIFGYTYDWTEISKNYRVVHNLTCERCSTTVEKGYDERFLHVHHQNGDKTYNHTSNLECLCILCHSAVDEHHDKNFSTQRMKNIICDFLKSYESQLKSKNKALYKKHRAICNKA